MSLYHIEQANMPLKIIQPLSLFSFFPIPKQIESQRKRIWFEGTRKTLMQGFQS